MWTRAWGNEAESICSIRPPSKKIFFSLFLPTLHSPSLEWVILNPPLPSSTPALLTTSSTTESSSAMQLLNSTHTCSCYKWLLPGGSDPGPPLFTYRHHKMSYVQTCTASGHTCGRHPCLQDEMKERDNAKVDQQGAGRLIQICSNSPIVTSWRLWHLDSVRDNTSQDNLVRVSVIDSRQSSIKTLSYNWRSRISYVEQLLIC